MSEVKVNKISPRSGTDVQLGDSGDTITVPSGATLDASNATTTLPSNIVTTDGTQTLANKTIDASQLTGTITPSDGTVTNAKIANSTIELAKLSATGTKDATTFLRGDNTFAEAGGGAMELLTTVNQTSSVSSISVDGFVSSTYFAYKIFVQNVTLSTDPLWIYLRVNQSGSAITTSSYYSTWYGRNVKTSSAANSNDQDADTFVKLTDTFDTAAGDNMLLEITLSDFNQTSKYKYGSFNSSSHYNDVGAGGEYFNVNGGFEFRDTGACSGFTLFRPSGNIDNMDIKVYGIKG